MRRRFDKTGAEERHHRHGDRKGSKQREPHRQRECREQIFADAVQEGDREEHHYRGQSGRQHGERHFPPALFRGDFRALAEFQVAIDVFQHHDGVIDQAREGQRKAAEHHAVDRTAAHAKAR